MAQAFICDAVRTPIGRYGGALARVRADDLAAVPIKALVARNPKVDWDAIDDVLYGCATQAGEDGRNVARNALLLAGLSSDISGVTVNRLCGSGMQAVADGARAIRLDEAEIVVAGGVECMSRSPFVMPKPEAAFAREPVIYDTTLGRRFPNKALDAAYGTDTLGDTAENVAEQYQITREAQDALALLSQRNAGRAQEAGHLAAEIVPVVVPSGRKGETQEVTQDEHPRPQTTIEALAKLPAIFRKGGTVTAGNSSGVNDGSVAMIVASEAAMKRYGLTPKARVVSSAAAGVPPRVMGMGPVPATERLFARLGLKIDDIDIIELNEAFAAQGVAVLRQLGVADGDPRVNPQGGAIALGHPLGMSGARLVATAAHQLARNGGRRALCTMCIGVGQGISMVIERV